MMNMMQTSEFVICVQNNESDDLQIRRIYQVIPDNDALMDGYLRIIDDSDEDYLYPVNNFVFVDFPQSIAKIIHDLQTVPA